MVINRASLSFPFNGRFTMRSSLLFIPFRDKFAINNARGKRLSVAARQINSGFVKHRLTSESGQNLSPAERNV